MSCFQVEEPPPAADKNSEATKEGEQNSQETSKEPSQDKSKSEPMDVD